MNMLDEKSFRRVKTSETLVIYGSGSSIGKLTKEQIIRLGKLDSIGFNWFCKSNIPVTFYFIREQANTKKRIDKNSETKDLLLKFLNSEPYLGACRIVQNVHMEYYDQKTRDKILSYHQILHEIDGSGVVFKESRDNPRNMPKFDIFKEGIIHGKTSLCNILHIASWFKYERIIFAGIDLYDSRYFWLKPGEKRKVTKSPPNKKHKVASVVRDLVSLFKKMHPKVKILVVNPKSLIAKLGDGIWK